MGLIVAIATCVFGLPPAIVAFQQLIRAEAPVSTAMLRPTATNSQGTRTPMPTSQSTKKVTITPIPPITPSPDTPVETI